MSAKRKPKRQPVKRPHYDAENRELWAKGKSVKKFRQPAARQELVLQAFQELGWPAWIDDPLRPIQGKSSQQHLHDTIANLNRRQRAPLILFSGDGTGKRIAWRWR